MDKEQAESIDDHFKEIMDNDTPIPTEGWKVTFHDLPEWYNEHLFKKAQHYYKCHILGYVTSALMGLIDVLAVPSILKVLIFTKQSGTPCAAFRRYAMTVLHTHYMYSEDIYYPKSKFFKTLTTIRWKHCKASKLCQKAQQGVITYRDLALTQFGFLGYFLTKSKEFGFSDDPEEKEAVVHFWRVIGHLIGIPERLNICRESVAETVELCDKILNEVMTKYIKESPPHFREMSIIMLEGATCIDFTIDPESSLSFCHKLHGLPHDRQLSFYSWLNAKYHDIIFMLCGLPVIGYFTKSYYNAMLKILFSLLDGHALCAWLKFGKANSQFLLYPEIS